MALGRLVTLNRKSTKQYYYSVYFFLCLCEISFSTLNKMLVQLFAPEIFPLSSHLFFVHTSALWFSGSPTLGINLLSEGGMSGIHGEIFWSFKIQRTSFSVSAIFGVCTKNCISFLYTHSMRQSNPILLLLFLIPTLCYINSTV